MGAGSHAQVVKSVQPPSGAELRGREFLLKSSPPTQPRFLAAGAAILPDVGVTTTHADSAWAELSNTPTEATPTRSWAELFRCLTLSDRHAHASRPTPLPLGGRVSYAPKSDVTESRPRSCHARGAVHRGRVLDRRPLPLVGRVHHTPRSHLTQSRPQIFEGGGVTGGGRASTRRPRPVFFLGPPTTWESTPPVAALWHLPLLR